MFFTIKLYLHLNCVVTLNWIVWNRTIFIKIDLALNNLQRLICHKTLNNQPTSQSWRQNTCTWGKISLWTMPFTSQKVIKMTLILAFYGDTTGTSSKSSLMIFPFSCPADSRSFEQSNRRSQPATYLTRSTLNSVLLVEDFPYLNLSFTSARHSLNFLCHIKSTLHEFAEIFLEFFSKISGLFVTRCSFFRDHS